MLDINVENFHLRILIVITSFIKRTLRIVVILTLTLFVIRFLKFGLGH